MAEAFGAEVIAVHALGLLSHIGAETVPSEAHRDEVQAMFERDWCSALDRTPVSSRRVMRDGNPVVVVLGQADEEQVDLIVLGSRGTGGFPELTLGSTSHQVAQHSRRPVLIIPA